MAAPAAIVSMAVLVSIMPAINPLPPVLTASLVNPAVNSGDAAGDSYISIEGLDGSQFQ